MEKHFYHDNQQKVEIVDHNSLIDRLIKHNPYYIIQNINPLTITDLYRFVNEGRITADGMVPFKLHAPHAPQPDNIHTLKAELKLLPHHYPLIFPDLQANADERLFNNTPPQYRKDHASTVLARDYPDLDGGRFVVSSDVVFETLHVENVPVSQFMPILLQHPHMHQDELKTVLQMLDVYNRQQDAVNERTDNYPLLPVVQQVVSKADVEMDSDFPWRSEIRLRYEAENWLMQRGYMTARPQYFVCGFNAGDPEIKDKMLKMVRQFNKQFYQSGIKDFAYAATDMKENIHVMVCSNNPDMLHNAHVHCLGFKDMFVVEDRPLRDIRWDMAQEATLKCGGKEVVCHIYNEPLFDEDTADEFVGYRSDGKYIYPYMTDAPNTVPVFVDRILNVYKDDKPEILSTRPVDNVINKHLENRYHRKEENRPLMYRPTARGAWFYQTGGSWCAWLDKQRVLHTLGQSPGMKSLKRINEIAASQNIVLGGKLILNPLDDLGKRTFIKEASGNIVDVDLALCTDGKVHTVKDSRLVDMDGWQDVTGRITEAKVNVINPQRMTVQCMVDGEIQMPKELGPFYRKLYQSAVAHGNGDAYVRHLAHQYFKDELLQDREVAQSKGLGR